MLFHQFRDSGALDLERYSDFDQFRRSETYAGAESTPLRFQDTAVIRASLALASVTLSLVKTFPRIIKGYDLGGRRLIVLPMNEVSSTRLNGKLIGQSLILINGKTDCTVAEPEGRLVAIVSFRGKDTDPSLFDFDSGHAFSLLQPGHLVQLQSVVHGILLAASTEPAMFKRPEVRIGLEETLVSLLGEALSFAKVGRCGRNEKSHYLAIARQLDQKIIMSPLDTANARLASEIGVSERALQNASQSVYGMAVHRYSRLRRLWSVRRQLRCGAPGLTVKASALAHGFWHQSQFSLAYKAHFGELPSDTLRFARREISSGH